MQWFQSQFKICAVLGLISLSTIGCAPKSQFVKLADADEVRAVAFSPDGKMALASGWGKMLKLWDLNSGHLIQTLKHGSNVNAVAFSPNGKMVLSGGNSNLKLWDLGNERVTLTMTHGHGVITSLRFSPDGKTALSGGWDDALKFWNLDTGLFQTLEGHSGDVNAVAFSPDGKMALSGSNDDTLKLWNLENRYVIRTLRGHSGDVQTVVFSPDGKTALSGSHDNTVKLWNLDSGHLIRTLTGHSSNIETVAVSPDGQTALSGGWLGEVILWDLNSEHFGTKKFDGIVYSLAVSPDSKTALVGTSLFSDGALYLINAQTGQEIAQMVAFEDGEWMTITPQGNYVASANAEKYLKMGDKARFNQPEKVRQALQQFTSFDEFDEFAENRPSPPLQSISTATSFNSAFKTDTIPPRIVLHQRGLRGLKNTLVADTTTYLVKGQVTDKSGVASVTLNGKPAILEKPGHFSAQVPLQIGKNTIHVIATDIYNNTARKNFIIIRRKSSSSPVLFAGHYHALVIGINRYQFLTNLVTAVNDAQKVAKVLKNQYGFTVTLLLDKQATRQGINRTFNQLSKTLGEDDHLLIYYAGHGYYDKAGEKAYWLPADAKDDDDTEWLIADRITTHIRRNPAKNILIVADSCYSGTLTRKRSGNLDLSSTMEQTHRHRYLNKMLNKSSRVLIASGGNEPVTDLGGDGHSIFAQAFLEALREIEETVFTAEELFIRQRIQEKVAGKVAQTPEFQIIRQSGHDSGDFVFQRQ